jgi:hypothetical protein
MAARARATRTSRTTKKEDVKATQPTAYDNYHGYHYAHRRTWLWPILIVVLLILMFGFFASWSGYRFDRYGRFGLDNGYHMRGQMGNGYFGGQYDNNQLRIEGVVTTVNGSSFTVSGHGNSNTVQTDSNTHYQNGSAVKVNDSITVYGTINNGTFMASTVVINP